MPDLDTCRMPRDTLLGLIASTSQEERITAPIPIPTLTELLGEDTPRSEPQDVVVRFTPHAPILAVAAPASGVHIVERSHWIVAISAAVTVLAGIAVVFFA